MNNDINFQPPDENPDDIGFNGLGQNETNEFDSGDGNIENFDLGGIDSGDPADGAAGIGMEPAEPEPPRHRFVMPERFSVSGLWRAFRDYWIGLAQRTKTIFVSSMGGLLLLAVIMTVVLNQSPWVRIYGALDNSEAGEIIMILDANRIPHEWDSSLRTISVRARDEARALGTLTLQGYPKSGIIYEEETGGGILETQAEKANREKRNRERRLEAAFNAIAGVNFSTVTFNIPDNSRNVLMSEREPATAMVMLDLKPGFVLSPDAVRGIENMVQKSGGNLLPENITINDGNGVQLNVDTGEPGGETKTVTIAELQYEFERRREREIRNQVMEFLSGPYGADGVRMMLSVTVNFDDLIIEAKNFSGANINPDTDEQSGVLSGRAFDYFLRTQDPDAIGYAPGVNNPDADGYYEYASDPSEGIYSEELHRTEEFLVNYILRQSHRRGAFTEHISLAVVVDADELDADVEENFYNAMATGTGISEIIMRNVTEDIEYDELLRQYITIGAMRFLDSTGIGLPPLPVPGVRIFQMLMILGASVIVIIIIVIFIIAAMSKRSRERELYEEREAAILAGGMAGVGIMDEIDPSVASLGLAIGKRAVAGMSPDDDDDLETIEAKEKTLKRQIKLFADQNPDIAAQLVRTLIKGDEMPGG